MSRMYPALAPQPSVKSRDWPPQGDRIGRALLYLALIGWTILFLLPVLWMLSTSFKQVNETYQIPIQWIPSDFDWSNYSDAWQGAGNVTFSRYFLNSFIVALGVTLGHVLLATMGGYGLAKFQFKGRRVLLVAILATLMVPLEVIMIPLYLTARDLGWLDSYQGMIVPLIADAFGVFLMRQAFLAVPDSLIDAARVDGASHPRIFFRIGIPLVWPSVAVLTIFIFRETWDNFLWPFIVVQSGEMRTFPLGLKLFFSAHLTDVPDIMAISTVATIPLAALYFIFQKAFIQGVAMSGMKG